MHLSIIAHMSRTPPGHLPEILTVGPASSLHQRFMSSCCSSSCCCSSSSGSSTGGGSSSSSSSGGGGVAIQTNLLKLVHPKKVQNRPPTNLNPKSQTLTKLFLNPKPLRNPKPEIQHPPPTTAHAQVSRSRPFETLHLKRNPKTCLVGKSHEP